MTKQTDYVLMNWCMEAGQGLYTIHKTAEAASEINDLSGGDSDIYERVTTSGALGRFQTLVLIDPRGEALVDEILEGANA